MEFIYHGDSPHNLRRTGEGVVFQGQLQLAAAPGACTAHQRWLETTERERDWRERNC